MQAKNNKIVTVLFYLNILQNNGSEYRQNKP